MKSAKKLKEKKNRMTQVEAAWIDPTWAIMYSWINHHRAHTLHNCLCFSPFFPVSLTPSELSWIDVICLFRLQATLAGHTQFGSQIKQKLKCVPCWEPRAGGWVRGRARWKIHLPWFSSSSMARFSEGTQISDKICTFPRQEAISAEPGSVFTSTHSQTFPCF